MAIELLNITKRFGNLTALDNVSISLGENRIYGLLGSNGAGKTTLLNIITNRLYPDSGQLLIDGEDAADNDRALGKVFMIGEANLYPDDMKVRRAFQAAQMFYPDFDMENAKKVSRLFGLDTQRKIKNLSTGYGSIFRLVLALSVNTPYLLLDEPVLGLDARHRDIFYKLLLEKYAHNPCTILISTHLIQEAADLMEHALIIHRGRLLHNKPAEELLEGAYSLSGPIGLMDTYLLGKTVISEGVLGGLKTACVEGIPEAVPMGLETGRLDLQDYFISLMNREDRK